MSSLMQHPTAGRRPRRALAGLLASFALVAASCGSDSDATADATAEESTDAAVDASAEESTEASVEISGAWARTSPMAVDRGAAYMELLSAEGDRLVAASVDSSIAGSVEIHETVAVGDADMAEDDMAEDGADEGETDGMEEGSGGMEQAMMMRELPDGLELPAGEVVALAPGGLHIMLLELVQPLAAGETFELVLEFEKAGTQTVTVDILDAAP